MYETLRYLATHLDCYRFHSDKAREWKRDLERWSTLSLPEQKDAEQILVLFHRFQSMFANDPFLEQNGFLSTEQNGTDYPADITGRTAEAYFTADWRPLTLHPKGTRQGDAQAVFYSDAQLLQLSRGWKEKGKEAALKTAKQLATRFQAQKGAFSHILQKNFLEHGKKRHSPNLLDLAAALVFHALCAGYLIHDWYLSEFLSRYGLRVSEAGQWELLRAGKQAAVLLFFLVLLPASVDLVRKAVYRLHMLWKFQGKEARLNRLVLFLQDTDRAQNWRDTFVEQIKKDRASVAEGTELCLAKQASYAMLLHPRPSLADRVSMSDQPWSKYRKPGERQRVVLRLALSVLVAVFCL